MRNYLTPYFFIHDNARHRSLYLELHLATHRHPPHTPHNNTMPDTTQFVCTTLYYTIHCLQHTTPRYSRNYTALHYTTPSTLQCCTTLRYTTLSTVQCCTTLRYTTLHTFIFFLFQGVLKTPVTLTCGSDPCVGKFCSSDPDARCFTDFQCKASFWNLNVKEEIMECKGKVVHVHYLVLNTNENRQLGTY